jgi:hypothetical protein
VIIRPYAGLPRTYAPDIGEVVEARRTLSEEFIRAVVLDVKRNREGGLRVRVQWLSSNPQSGVTGSFPIEAGTVGWIVTKSDPAEPPMIKQIDRGPASGD